MLIEMVCLSGYFGRLYHAWAFMPKWRHWQDRKILIVLACLLVCFKVLLLYQRFSVAQKFNRMVFTGKINLKINMEQ